MGHGVSGDETFVCENEDAGFAAIIDGLGHGPEAAESAKKCVELLNECWCSDLEGLVTQLHRALRGLRGAAAGLCHVERATGRLLYIGVGNTVARCWLPQEERLISRDGVVGEQMRSGFVQTLPLGPGSVVVLHTDGVTSHFSLDDYPGLLRDHPRIVAQRVVQRFGKELDDASCVVLKCES